MVLTDEQLQAAWRECEERGIAYLPPVRIRSNAELLAEAWDGLLAVLKARAMRRLDSRWNAKGIGQCRDAAQSSSTPDQSTACI